MAITEKRRVEEQDEMARRYTILSYWIIVLIGLPLWWMTTKIERHPLPYKDIDKLIQSAPDHPPSASSTRVKGYPGYQLSFTVISKGNECVDVSVDYNKLFKPMIQELSSTMAYFKVDFQCRLQAAEPGPSAENFVRGEWNLGGNTISSLPIINFVHYLVDIDQTENYFVYPQWGAVAVTRDNTRAMAFFKRAFVEQLFEIRDLKGWFAEETMRCRHEAIDSLRALVTVLGKNANMPVSRQVSEWVHVAVNHLMSMSHTKSSDNQAEQYGMARNALDAAEAAFFHPAMLARQYFPSENMLAVHLTLFLPLLMPVVVQTLKFLKESRQSVKSV